MPTIGRLALIKEIKFDAWHRGRLFGRHRRIPEHSSLIERLVEKLAIISQELMTYG